MTPPKVPNDEQIRETLGEVGDALQRALVLSSERIQSVFEDAVVRGRMTRRDAEELASSLVAAGRDQAAELQGEFDGLIANLPPVIADAVDAVDPRGAKRRKAAPAEGAAAAQTEAAKLADAGAPKAAAKPAAKKPAAKKAPVKKPAAKKPAAKKPAAKKAPAKKPAAKTAAAKASATAAAKPVAKKPAAAKKAPAKKPAATTAAKKPAATTAAPKPAATKPKPAPAPTTATKPHVAEPVKQGAGPTPSPAPNAATASVRELMTAIPKLTKTELSELLKQETAGKNRKTVLDAINKKLA